MKSLWADLRLTNRKSIWEWGGGWVTVRHEMSWSYLANGGCRTPAVWLSSSHSPSAWCHLGERGQRHHTVRFVIITTQTEDIDQMRSDTHILGHCSYFFCGVKVLIIISFIPNLFKPTLLFLSIDSQEQTETPFLWPYVSHSEQTCWLQKTAFWPQNPNTIRATRWYTVQQWRLMGIVGIVSRAKRKPCESNSHGTQTFIFSTPSPPPLYSQHHPFLIRPWTAESHCNHSLM